MCCVVPAITLSARSDLGKRRLDHQLRRSCRAARPALACQLVHLVGIEHAGPGVGLTASAEYSTTYIGVEARLLDPEPLGCLSRADPVRHSRSSLPRRHLAPVAVGRVLKPPPCLADHVAAGAGPPSGGTA